jgi:hypothetical protein
MGRDNEHFKPYWDGITGFFSSFKKAKPSGSPESGGSPHLNNTGNNVVEKTPKIYSEEALNKLDVYSGQMRTNNNFQDAAKFAYEGAIHGNKNCQSRISLMFLRGEGFEQSDKFAYVWAVLSEDSVVLDLIPKLDDEAQQSANILIEKRRIQIAENVARRQNPS